MTDIDAQDSLTKLNTQLNKSMVLMDNDGEYETQTPKRTKSIKINTKIQPASASKGTSPGITRKSILKKPEKKENNNRNSTSNENIENNFLSLRNTAQRRVPASVRDAPRPRNLQDLVQEEGLVTEPISSTFNLNDLSDSEDVWIMDIPTTVEPKDLTGQTLVIGQKSKFKVKEERYCAVSHNIKCNVTCVFDSGNSQYKAVNIKPVGAISVRRKLSGVRKIKPIEIENSSVPFPKNLKTRHPLFGVGRKGKIRKGAIK